MPAGAAHALEARSGFSERDSAVRDTVVSEIPFLAPGKMSSMPSTSTHWKAGVRRLEKGLCALAGKQGWLCKLSVSALGSPLLQAVDYVSLC